MVFVMSLVNLLIHREDDKTEVVENRFKVYGETKAEIIDFYGSG